MSRRGAEFQHRTSVFEGAYRAWSHLGRLDPIELETKTVSELDPTNYNSDNLPSSTVDVETGRDYPYEPLPRSGLAHPYIKAILTPWLGSYADEDGIKLGLETLRTWWQHRRKGQNTSAMKALSTSKMRTAVDEYTRHFFQIAHCLIVSDDEQPPKGLQMRLKESGRITLIKPKNNGGDSCPSWKALMASSEDDISESQLIDIKGKCIPGKLNLPDVLDGINHRALQMAHRGVTSSETTIQPTITYGDPSKFPVVYQSHNGDISIALIVNGMICAHCIKIVETVLKGCTGHRSPIDGLLDAAADQEFDGVLIKIDNPANARRIAFESARNLSLVGYKAEAVHFVLDDESIDNDTNGSSRTRQRSTKLRQLLQTCEQFGTNSAIIFDWTVPCSCTDAGVYRFNCRRHSQMLPQVLQNFYIRKQDVIDYISGETSQQVPQQQQEQVESHLPLNGVLDTEFNNQLAADVFDDETIVIEQDMKFQYYNAVDTDPIPLDLNTIDFAYIQQALGTSNNQQQQYCIPSPQPVGYHSNIRNVHDQTYSSSRQGSRRNARAVSTQQHISALDAQYFLASQYDWVDSTHAENDPEVLLRST